MDLIWEIIIGYFILINIITLAMFGIDKSRAKKTHSRISEPTLFLFSFLGGAPAGVFGMRLFHHKTKKTGFKVIMGLLLLVNLAAYGWLVYMFFTGADLGFFNL